MRAGPRRTPDEPVVLAGFLGTGNLGNDVSLAVVADAIRRRQPTMGARVLSFGPAQTTITGLPVTSLPLSRTTPLGGVSRVADRVAVKAMDVVSIGRLLARSRHVVVPGSGNLESGLGNGAWGLPWALAATAVLARLTGAQLHLLSVGADRPTDPRTTFLNRVTARLAASRSFRDELSRESVAGLGIDTAGDVVGPDLAFGRAGAHSDGGAPTPLQGRIGLGVQAWYGHANVRETGGSAHRAYVEKMGRIAARLLDDGLGVTLLIGDVVDETVLEPIRHVVAEQGHDPDAVEVHVSPDFDDLVRVMKELDVVIGSRYHNIIGAILAARPVISLGYGPKHRVLLADLDLASHAHDIDDIDVGAVIAQVRRARLAHVQMARDLRREALHRGALVEQHVDDFVARLAEPTEPVPARPSPPGVLR